MLTMNHTATKLLAMLENGENLSSIDTIVSQLLLPDAIRMYGARQVFHFTEHPVTGQISTVVFNTTPDNLKGIKNNLETNLQADIPKAAVDEMSHPEVFAQLNPDWVGSGYETHLHQDVEWDRWIRTLIDVSGRFDDRFVYNKTGKVVNGATLRKDLFPMDDLFFIAVAKRIKAEFGVIIDADWFEKHVHQSFLRDYDEELAENTWKYINIPALDKPISLPEFVTQEEIEAEIDNVIKASR